MVEKKINLNIEYIPQFIDYDADFEIRDTIINSINIGKNDGEKVKIAISIVYSIIKNSTDYENILAIVMLSISTAVESLRDVPDIKYVKKFITNIAISAIPDNKMIKVF